MVCDRRLSDFEFAYVYAAKARRRLFPFHSRAHNQWCSQCPAVCLAGGRYWCRGLAAPFTRKPPPPSILHRHRPCSTKNDVVLRHSPFLLQNLHPEKCAASVHDWLRAEQADNAAHLCIETAATLVLEVVTVPTLVIAVEGAAAHTHPRLLLFFFRFQVARVRRSCRCSLWLVAALGARSSVWRDKSVACDRGGAACDLIEGTLV